MAKAKGPQAKGQDRINYTHAVQFFRRLDAGRALALMTKAFPERSPQQVGTHLVKMHCPLPDHADQKASFELDTLKGHARCRSTYCQFYTRNLLDLFVRAKGWTAKDALLYVQAETGLRLATEKVEREFEALDVHHWAVRALFAACATHLQHCLVPPGDDTAYSDVALRSYQPALAWLYEHRRHLSGHAAHLHYGVMPALAQALKLAEAWLARKADALYGYGDEHAARALNAERRGKILARAQELLKDVDAAWVGAVTFHTGLTPTTPGRLRLRLPKDEKVYNVLPGYTDDEPNGFFGLFAESAAVYGADESMDVTWLAVEGENDAISLQERFLEAGHTGVRVVATCGDANETDQLARAGVTRVYLVGDEPSEEGGKGDGFVQRRLVSAVETDVRVFVRWDQLAEGSPKDPDQAIQLYGTEVLWRLLVTDRDTTYVAADRWAIGKAVEAASRFPEDELKQRTACAAGYGQCARHPALLAHFVEEVAEALGLSATVLRGEIVKARDDEAGYISRIVETIRQEFHVLFKEDNARGGTLTLFHKKSRRYIEFFMTDGEAMIAQFSNVFGDMYAFFRDHVGLFGAGGDPNLEGNRRVALIKDVQKDLREYLKFAMQEINHNVPTKQECDVLGQGLFYKPRHDAPGEHCAYVNNGTRVYKITWPRPGQPVIDVVELEGPSDGPYVFEPGARPWSKVITGVDALKSANALTTQDVRTAVHAVKRLFDTCLRWKHQEITSTYLAWHLLSLAVHNAFPTKVMLAFQGESGSGKSTASSVFTGSQYKSIQLLEAFLTAAQYTLASIIQTWNGSALGMCLEEFEDDGNGLLHKGLQVANINEALRQSVGDEGITVRRGTAAGKSRTYLIHVPIILTGILGPRMPQDQNRRYTVETVREEGLKDTLVAIGELFSAEELAAIRRVVTLGLIPHMPMLARMHDEVVKDLNQNRVTDFAVPMRFLRNFVPLACVMKLLGEDYRAFVREACVAHREQLAAQAHNTLATNLFEKLLRLPLQVSEGAKSSVISLLSKAEEWRLLNRMCVGVYYDEATQTLMVDWLTACSPGGIFYRVEDFQKMTSANLKYAMDQHPNAVKTQDYAGLGVYVFLRTQNVIAQGHDLSVVRVHEIVATVRANHPLAPVVALVPPLKDEDPNKKGSGNI